MRYVLYKKQLLLNAEKNDLKRISTFSETIVCLSPSFLVTFQELLGNPDTTQLIAIPNPIKRIDKPLMLKKKKLQLQKFYLTYQLKIQMI